eukprot:Skav228812  [mRNA]  locus=scaffold359:295018:302827:+ [translate_table: standard]
MACREERYAQGVAELMGCYIEERQVELEAREAALPVMEKAWKDTGGGGWGSHGRGRGRWPWRDFTMPWLEVSAKARRESTTKRQLLAVATEHISKQLLKDQLQVSGEAAEASPKEEISVGSPRKEVFLGFA